MWTTWDYAQPPERIRNVDKSVYTYICIYSVQYILVTGNKYITIYIDIDIDMEGREIDHLMEELVALISKTLNII